MHKTGLKAFIYSFSASLLTIFAVAELCIPSSHKKNPEIKIPQKNIVLFLKSTGTNPLNYAAPIKKIALNTLPDNSPVNNEPIFEEPEIILAESIDNSDIPLEISQTVPEIFIASETVENNNPPPLNTPDDKDSNKTNISIAENEIEKVSIPLDVPIQASSITPHVIKEPIKVEKVKVASLTTEEQSIQKAKPEPIPLLPIEKTSNHFDLNDSTVIIGDTNKINQVALANKNIPISGMKNKFSTQQNPEEKNEKQKKWKNMSEQKTSPWTTAKARGVSKNQLVNEAEAKEENKKISKTMSPIEHSSEGVKLAAETIQNLLIPIPEKIINQENLTPKLSFDSKSPDNTEEAEKNITETTPKETETTKNKLLSSISTLLGGDKKSSSENKSGILDETKKTINKIKYAITSSDAEGKIMPTEMRLSFQPGRAEISGQTLRWIRAFATRAATDSFTAIEIRIDGTSATSLQQKRLNLLHNILISKGVPQIKINTVFTQREPNSFIIKLTPTTNTRKDTETKKTNQGYYQYW